MKTLRIIARALVLDRDRVLLVRNKDADFWYPPGGGWDYDGETVAECAAREVAEETGYVVEVQKLLWLQEYHEGGRISFETFWLSKISDSNTQTDDGARRHMDEDPDGSVEEVRWFTEAEVADITVFPERIRSFAALVREQQGLTDPFIGSFL